MATSFISVPERLSSEIREILRSLDLARGELVERTLLVNPCHDPRFGDYQTNIAMGLAKASSLSRNPRELATEISEKLKPRLLPTICHRIEIAGPGFINFHLAPDFVIQQAQGMIDDTQHEGISQTQQPLRVVIDFSSPNIAKSMHVGHIRSTFLGDALARIARAVGHKVITDNHLGDWGTQFGKLIYGYKHHLDPKALQASPIDEFERLYKQIHALSESNPNVLAAVRNELALLQAGDPENLKIWKQISDVSLSEFNKAYERMGVSFDFCLGESFYNPMLHEVVKELKGLGIAEESQGAICIFFQDNPALKDAAPMVIQKSDGAFLYATTDLATVQYRIQEWKAEEILYVTDARQQLHFKQLFAAVGRWFERRKEKGAIATPVLRHIVFGSILGPDRTPIKTRSGDPIKLKDLLDEAEARAFQIIREKNPDLPETEQRHAARIIGIGALKYADLCQNRNLDYIFDWDKLLALQGNTAPYLVYAYVRIRSIFRASAENENKRTASLRLSTPEELALSKHLIQFSDTVHAILEDHRPHLMASYLYDLASKFSKFYEACPVLQAEEPIRSSRLELCNLTARTLRKGLFLLGIETLERM